MPNYSARTLTEWMRSDLPLHNSRALDYFVDRTACVLDILDETEIVSKNALVLRLIAVAILIHLQGICARLWNRLLLRHQSRFAVQGRIVSLPYRETGKLRHYVS